MALTISERMPLSPTRYSDRTQWESYLQALKRLAAEPDLSAPEKQAVRSELEFAAKRLEHIRGGLTQRGFDRLCTGVRGRRRRAKPREKRRAARRRATRRRWQVEKLDVHAGTLRDMGDRFVSAWKRAEAGEVFDERIVRLRKYRGRLPAGFRFDRESLSEGGKR
jgi:hypothetical protein